MFHVLFYNLGIHQDVININDHEHVQLFIENEFIKVMNIDKALHNPN